MGLQGQVYAVGHHAAQLPHPLVDVPGGDEQGLSLCRGLLAYELIRPDHRGQAQGQHRHPQSFSGYLPAVVAYSGPGCQARVRNLQHGAELFPAGGGQGVQNDDAPGLQLFRYSGDKLEAFQSRLRQDSGGQSCHRGKAREFCRHGLQHVPGDQNMGQGQWAHGVRR